MVSDSSQNALMAQARVTMPLRVSEACQSLCIGITVSTGCTAYSAQNDTPRDRCDKSGEGRIAPGPTRSGSLHHHDVATTGPAHESIGRPPGPPLLTS